MRAHGGSRAGRHDREVAGLVEEVAGPRQALRIDEQPAPVDGEPGEERLAG